MKRNPESLTRIMTTVAVTYLLLFTLFAGIAISAGDRVITGTLKSVTVATDKNGKEYVRISVPEQKTLNGIKYEADTLVLCFGNTVAKAKTLKAGDKVSMIVNSRTSKDGRESTTALAFAN